METPPFYITEESVRDAYYECLKNKKSTLSAVTFRVNERENIRDLYREILSGTYSPGKSIVFITEGREVFADFFRDRVVQTWVCLRVNPHLEQEFVPTTWNCRKGKGTLKAVQNLRRQIAEATKNFTVDAYVQIYDLSGFFMGIHRDGAADRLCAFLEDRFVGNEKATLLWLVRKILTHAPEKDCIRVGNTKEWDNYPQRKSLFFNPGLPIGKFLSQIDGNFELNVVDHYIMCLSYVDRYVDDTARISRDKSMLLNTMPTIRKMLSITCGAKVNPRKYKFINCNKDGFKYLGVIINKDKAYVSGKIVGRAYNLIRYYNKRISPENAEKFMQRLNSYLGMMIHYDNENERKWLISLISDKWDKYIIRDETCRKITLKTPTRCIIRENIRNRRKQFNNLKYSIKCHLSELQSRQSVSSLS